MLAVPTEQRLRSGVRSARDDDVRAASGAWSTDAKGCKARYIGQHTGALPGHRESTVCDAACPALSTSHAVAGMKQLGHAGEMPSEPATYPGYRFPAEVISHGIWLYHTGSW